MKTSIKIVFAMIILSVAISSCKKSKKTTPVGPLGPNFPYALNSLITPALLDTMENDGLVVNPGLTPATVNGIYLLSPDSCTFDNSVNSGAGTLYADLLFQFSNQNNSTSTIDFVYKTVNGTDSENGAANDGSIVSGGGMSFTIFAQDRDTTEGVASVLLFITSGQVVSGGIKNMQFAFYVKSKGPDPNGYVVPVGTFRIFDNEGGLAATQSSYSIKTKPIQSLRARAPRSIHRP